MLSLLLSLSLAHAAPGVAVLELYTSEGCSSCPAADQLLVKLLDEAHAQQIAVYPLAFHVDYWNRLGWPDPYSEADWSARQAEWQQRLGNSSIYTPQLIVNGKAEFVGSDEAMAREAIRAALAQPAEVTVGVRSGYTGGGSVTATLGLAGVQRQVDVSVVLVEDGLSMAVPKGENAGRTLNHSAVVRSLKRERTSASGPVNVVVSVPSDVDRTHARLVVVVQDTRSGAVLGAAETAL